MKEKTKILKKLFDNIGEGTVIGAGSVVAKDISENCVAVGNPCRVIRNINEERVLEQRIY